MTWKCRSRRIQRPKQGEVDAPLRIHVDFLEILQPFCGRLGRSTCWAGWEANPLPDRGLLRSRCKGLRRAYRLQASRQFGLRFLLKVHLAQVTQGLLVTSSSANRQRAASMARYIAGVLFLLAAATLTPTFVAPAMAPRQISGAPGWANGARSTLLIDGWLPTARSDASADAMGGGRSATGSLVCVAGLLVFAQRQLRSSRSAEGKINSKITPEVPFRRPFGFTALNISRQWEIMTWFHDAQGGHQGGPQGGRQEGLLPMLALGHLSPLRWLACQAQRGDRRQRRTIDCGCQEGRLIKAV
eukprot:s1602_g3.t1